MGPLQGLRIVEFGGIGPGPHACMLLADLGADILRIERIGSERSRGAADPTLRGRPAIGVDLKAAAGRALAIELVSRADALVEGFRPGVMERLGLAPEQCHARNPRLVYGRMTGWGQSGPLASAAGHDINYIALTGALEAIGESERGPVPPLNLVGDYGGGSLFLALGVVSAVLEARASGKGQVVDAAIIDGTTSLMAALYGKYAAGSWHQGRGSNGLDGGAPWYGTYATADGKHMAVGAIEPAFFRELCARLAIDPDWVERRLDPTRWPQLRDLLAERFSHRTRAEWTAVFTGTDACVAPVLSAQEAAEDPHMRARQVHLDLDGVLQPAVAPRLSRTPGAVRGTDDQSARRALEDVWACDPVGVASATSAGALRI